MEDKRFRTSDTALASYLIAESFTLYRIDYSKPRFEFVFPDSLEIQELSSKYITGKALIEPITFNRINKKLLRIIRKQKQWEED